MVENPKFKGFTLLELIVAMAIIAVLIGLSLLGIQTVQRSSRDTQRRETLQAINLELTDYYGNKNAYPAKVNMTFNAAGTTITVGAAGKSVTLGGAAIFLGTGTVTATAAGSGYCYLPAGSSYRVGVTLESGGWFTMGNNGLCVNADAF